MVRHQAARRQALAVAEIQAVIVLQFTGVLLIHVRSPQVIASIARPTLPARTSSSAAFDVVKGVAMGNDPVEIEFAGLEKTDVAGNVDGRVGVAAFATGQDLAVVQRQGMDRNVLVVSRHAHEDRAPLGAVNS